MTTRNKEIIVIGLNDLLVGGVQQLALDQMNGLGNEAYDIHLITLMQFDNQGTFYDRVPPYVQVHKLEFSGLFDLKSWFDLYVLLWKLKPRIVKTALFFSNTIFRILKPFCGYTVVAAEHNTEEKRPVWQRLLNRILAVWTYRIVADSYTVATFLTQTEHIPSDKFTVIYNGIDLNEILSAQRNTAIQRATMRTSLGIAHDEKVFLNVARMAHQKNHALMIESFEQLCMQRNDLKLVIVGDGKLRGDIETQIRHSSCADKIILVGEQKNIYPYYVASDFFLLTSRREGFCITAMIGLGFGLPLISTKVAGVIEYTKDGENGFLAEHTVDSIVLQMNKALTLTEPELSAFRIAAHQTAQGFSKEIYIQKYRQLMQEICTTK